MRPLFVHKQGEALLGRDGLTLATLPEEFQRTFPELSPKYIDPASLLAGLAAKRALSEGPSMGSAVIVGTAFGAIEATLDFDAQALAKGPNAVNPMDFPNTVANAPGSRIGIWLQQKGPNVTLTNGATSLVDAMGFAWEGYNGGLFERCLVGAVEKVPEFLKPFGASGAAGSYLEGAAFLSASGEPSGVVLFEVIDHLSLQLTPKGELPQAFQGTWESFFQGVRWLSLPEGTPSGAPLPAGVERHVPSTRPVALGLEGWEGLQAFLASGTSEGVLGAFHPVERKVALVKLRKKRSV